MVRGGEGCFEGWVGRRGGVARVDAVGEAEGGQSGEGCLGYAPETEEAGCAGWGERGWA